MVKTRPTTLLTFLLGLFVLVTGIGTRAYYLNRYSFQEVGPRQVWQVQGHSVVISPPDTTALDQLVANIKKDGLHHGFVAQTPLGPDKPEPTAFIAPLHPLYRAGLELLAENYQDTIPFTKTSVVRWVQVVLGGLTCLFYFIIAWRAFGQNHLLALLVGLATAVYPYWIINVAELEDGVLATFLLAWSLSLGVGIGQKGGVIRSLIFGIVLAALSLTRASLLPFAVVVQLWLFLRCRQLKNGGACAVMCFLGFLGGLAPWGYHCYAMLKAPVPLVTSAWFDVWAGNNEASTGGDYQWNMKTRLPVDLVRQLQDTPQAERYALLADRVLQEVVEHPGETAKRRMRAAMQFLVGGHAPNLPLFSSGEKATPPSWWVRPILMIALPVLFVLAFLGWRWSYGWKTHSAPVSLAIFWIPLPYLLTHAGPLHSSRLPLDGVLILLVGIGLLAMLPLLGARLMAGEQVEHE